jgi:hypothetical protein
MNAPAMRWLGRDVGLREAAAVVCGRMVGAG